MILNSVPFAFYYEILIKLKWYQAWTHHFSFALWKKTQTPPEFGLKHEKKKNISGFFRHSRFIFLKVRGLPPSIMQLLTKKH